MWNLFKRWAAAADGIGLGKAPESSFACSFTMALLSDTGCQRAINEDAGLIVHPTSHPLGSQKGLLAVVADGMGGYRGGEVASQLAVTVVSRTYFDEIGRPAQCLANALAAANRAIYQKASTDEQLAGMGTTCTALVLCDGSAFIAHVGDSRLYLIRDSGIYQMTEDHSLVMELVRKRVINAEEAREHPDRNVIQRALGRHPEVDVSSWPDGTPFQLGDCYLLCSDGLSGVLTDEAIKEVTLENDPSDACSTLIEMTRRAGAPDNITVGIIRVERAGDTNTALPPTREVQLHRADEN